MKAMRIEMMNKSGQSLVQVLVGIGLVGVLALAFTEFVRYQQKELRAIQQKQELTELKNTLFQIFSANSSYCSWQLATNSVTGIPNEINGTNISTSTTDPTVQIPIPRLYLGTSATSQLVASSEVDNNKVFGSQTNLKVESILLKDIFATGVADEYRGLVEVVIDPASLVRSLKPVQTSVIFKVNPISGANPLSARKVLNCGGGNSGGQILQKILVVDGAYKLGTVAATYGATVSSNQMIFNNTAPQNTDGDELMQISITPKSATSKLVVEAQMNLGFDGAGHIVTAVFVDNQAAALGSAVGSVGQGANQMVNLSLSGEYLNSSLNPRVFSVRAGGDVTHGFSPSDANPGSHRIFFNGAAGAGKLGGTLRSSLTVTEIEN